MALNSDGVEAIESVRNNWNELSIHFGNKLKLGRVGSMKLQGGVQGEVYLVSMTTKDNDDQDENNDDQDENQENWIQLIWKSTIISNSNTHNNLRKLLGCSLEKEKLILEFLESNKKQLNEKFSFPLNLLKSKASNSFLIQSKLSGDLLSTIFNPRNSHGNSARGFSNFESLDEIFQKTLQAFNSLHSLKPFQKFGILKSSSSEKQSNLVLEPSFQTNEEFISYLLSQHLKFFAINANEEERKQFSEQLNEKLILENAKSSLSKYNPIPYLIHWDLHGENILVDEDGKISILDFENALSGDSLMDFAKFRFYTFARFPQQLEKHEDLFMSEIIEKTINQIGEDSVRDVLNIYQLLISFEQVNFWLEKRNSDKGTKNEQQSERIAQSILKNFQKTLENE